MLRSIAYRTTRSIHRRWLSALTDPSRMSEEWKYRLSVWDSLPALSAPPPPTNKAIKVSLGVRKQGEGQESRKGDAVVLETTCDAEVETPLTIAKSLGVTGEWIVAKVNGKLVDLSHRLTQDAHVELLSWDDGEGKEVFWHSAAHVLGQAIEFKYGDKVKLTHGPPMDGLQAGFFYEMNIADGTSVSQEDFSSIMKNMQEIVKSKQQYERKAISKEAAKQMFMHNPYKLQIIDKLPPGEEITLYKNGPFIDLCRGPHVPHTGKLASFELLACGASHWEKGSGALLQRVYGISFPKRAQLQNWLDLREEAKARDHRVVGREQGLFMFHELSPGSAFMLPKGTLIYNRLCQLLRTQYALRGYQEVRTPLIYKKELWEQSGHWQNYKDDMFVLGGGGDAAHHHGGHEGHDHQCSHGHSHESSGGGGQGEAEAEVMALKPMNCPGHCLIYANTGTKSYKHLPIRYADFSTLHRNEATGALTGLTRCRRFAQDDAHIFCRPDQIASEIQSTLAFIDHIYGIFGFKFSMKLSTRPEKYVGDIETWNSAEDALKSSLDSLGREWTLNPGDGAFYGPKIDISVTDALQRQHQCATIQLDFQLPRRFDLKFKKSDGSFDTPVMIHRAILGSVERMMAILIEHTGGNWPFWLSPRQVVICPINAQSHQDYAHNVAEKFKASGLLVDTDNSTDTMQKKIRKAQLAKYNYILIVGDAEASQNTVNVRTRDGLVHGAKSVDTLLHDLVEQNNEHFRYIPTLKNEAL